MIKLRIELVVHVARFGEMRLHKILIEKPDEKRPLGRPRLGWKIILK
jgi:hypothetical protein